MDRYNDARVCGRIADLRQSGCDLIAAVFIRIFEAILVIN